MVKKIALGIMLITVILSLTGCMAPAATASELVRDTEKSEPVSSGYEKNLDGMISYLKDTQLIIGEGTDMSFDFIGAKAGKKFVYSYSGVNITCEIYEFDTANLNQTAKDIVSSVKEKGTFTSLDKEIKAQLSKNEQFMMSLVISGENDEVKALKTSIEEKFNTFA